MKIKLGLIIVFSTLLTLASMFTTSCSTIGTIISVVTNSIPVDTNNIPVVDNSTSTTQMLWDSVSCDWMIHGTSDENEIRQGAINQAASSGKAIRFKFRNTGSDFRFWVLWWESDVDKGKFPASHMWAPRARAAGVVKWVVDPNGADLSVLADSFKAYGDADHQLQYVGPITKEMRQVLGIDAQGIKTTPPSYR